jgi:CheY-like chemotaxis protein
MVHSSSVREVPGLLEHGVCFAEKSHASIGEPIQQRIEIHRVDVVEPRFQLFMVDGEMKSREGYETLRRIRDAEPQGQRSCLRTPMGFPRSCAE